MWKWIRSGYGRSMAALPLVSSKSTWSGSATSTADVLIATLCLKEDAVARDLLL